jgi:hypothetical protein
MPPPVTAPTPPPAVSAPTPPPPPLTARRRRRRLLHSGHRLRRTFCRFGERGLGFVNFFFERRVRQFGNGTAGCYLKMAFFHMSLLFFEQGAICKITCSVDLTCTARDPFLLKTGWQTS